MSRSRFAVMASCTLSVLLLGCSAEPVPPESSQEGAGAEVAESPPTVTRLSLRTDALADFYFMVRALAADPEAQVPSGWEEAVDATRGIQEHLGSFGGWGRIDTRVLEGGTPADVRARFETLSDPMDHKGREVRVRDDALRLADELERLAPSFERDLWPARSEELERRIAELERTFLPRHEQALSFMMDSLGIEDPHLELAVFLVTDMNPPGATTNFMRGGIPVCVLDAVFEGREHHLTELLLHEATHSLDFASRESEDVFKVLREGLEEKGLKRGDYLHRAVPHTVMFVQAEETIRRLYDPEHVAYGEAYGVYERTGPLADLERREWRRYLDGEQSRAEAIATILAAIDPDRPKPE